MTTTRHGRSMAAAAAIGAALAAAQPAQAQTTAPAQSAKAQNPLAGAGRAQQATATATVKSIDPATRHVVLTNAAGEDFPLKAPAEMHNFDRLKVGDRITVTYAVETEFALSPPNGKLPPDTQTVLAARAAKGEVPAGVVANHIVVTGAVLGVDPVKHTLKVVSPQGGEVHTFEVTSAAGRAALPKIKVGDYVTAYITEGLLIAASSP